MQHYIFEENTSYSTAILIKNSSFIKNALVTNYVYPLSQKGIANKDLIAFSLAYNSSGKAPTTLIKEYLVNLLKAVTSVGVSTIYCADAAYFKVLTNIKKAASAYIGYVLPCAIKGYEDIQVILGVNHTSLFHNPNNSIPLETSLNTLVSHINNDFIEPGLDIIKHEEYLTEVQSIEEWLNGLLTYPVLAADTETFSLKHYKAGLGTLGLAWDIHSGGVIRCDYEPLTHPQEVDVWDKKDKKFKKKLAHGKQIDNKPVKELIKQFLINYKGKLMWHNAAYDIKILIYTLWMDGDITNHGGLLEGLSIMTRHFDCTKLITYLATNNCVENKLSLKDIAHEFAGNYAQEEINDIRLIPENDLLRYNLIDCLCVWFAYEKNYPVMVEDTQEELYEGLFKESLITIIQMELTGMPMSMAEILKGEAELQKIYSTHYEAIQASPLVKETIHRLQVKWIDTDFTNRKNKAKNPDALVIRNIKDLYKKAPSSFPRNFNTNSGVHLAVLLYEVMGLPIIETTDTGLPSADADTLEALISHVKNIPLLTDEELSAYVKLIEDIRGQLGVSKILGTFIPAFKEAQLGKDGIYYLFGSFNLGGTKSGRLSSSNPNLTNIPSGSDYGKVVKRMFRGNTAWLFCGADFSSLEDYVSALTTKDPNKLKVYTDGYDSHSLRAWNYWPNLLGHIPNTVEGINSIKKLHEDLRSSSKPVTFLLTYDGTYHGLVKNCGFDVIEAKAIEASYHDMYRVSDTWKRNKLIEASNTGYVTIAFGLRLRTPLLKQVILNTDKTPYEARAESRTAGNALGQSYGLLNCRAANEMMQRARNSIYALDIKICAQIHDAIYLITKNDLHIVEWVNKNLTECMSWQELPELEHDTVKLNAELDIFYPSWEKPLTLKATDDAREIYTKTLKHTQQLNKKLKER